MDLKGRPATFDGYVPEGDVESAHRDALKNLAQKVCGCLEEVYRSAVEEPLEKVREDYRDEASRFGRIEQEADSGDKISLLSALRERYESEVRRGVSAAVSSKSDIFNFAPKTSAMIVLAGPPGCGKSHLLHGFRQAVIGPHAEQKSSPVSIGSEFGTNLKKEYLGRIENGGPFYVDESADTLCVKFRARVGLPIYEGSVQEMMKCLEDMEKDRWIPGFLLLDDMFHEFNDVRDIPREDVECLAGIFRSLADKNKRPRLVITTTNFPFLDEGSDQPSIWGRISEIDATSRALSRFRAVVKELSFKGARDRRPACSLDSLF